MSEIISPLAIKLGGRYTGLFSVHYEVGSPEQKDARMAVVTLPEDDSKMTWLQKGRTANRHRVRSIKRRKLAKRLLQVVVAEAIKRPLGASEISALRGLMNRRGYNRLEVEVDASVFENAPLEMFASLLPDYFNDHEPLQSQLEGLLEDTDTLRELMHEELFLFSKKDARAKLFASIKGPQKRSFLMAYHALQDAVASAVAALDTGQKHRCRYLDAIRDEIRSDSRLADIVEIVGEEPLFNIVGNISNQNLRSLRRYFNTTTMADGDYYDNTRLFESWKRFVHNMRPGNDEERTNKELLKDELAKSTCMLDTLKNISPMNSIPPYERQNNRRTPKDQTLWLDPLALNKTYGESVWRGWAKNLKKMNPAFYEGIEANLSKHVERESRLSEKNQLANELYYDSVFLQRILDRSKAIDPYKLRLLASRKNNPDRASKNYLTLQNHLGGNPDAFIAFASKYFTEVRMSQRGLWVGGEGALLERANINPPAKKNIQHVLVGNVLGTAFTPELLESFIKDCWSQTVKGRTTLRSLSKAAAEIQKTHGPSLGREISKIRYLQSLSKTTRKLTTEESAIARLLENAEIAYDLIMEHLKSSPQEKRYYSNIYALASIYNIIETDSSGFSRQSRAALLETQWRTAMVGYGNGEVSSRCVRLPADSTRPFDGVLRRTLEAQAHRAAQFKADQIKELVSAGASVSIPIAIEENKFASNVGLNEIKKNRSAANKTKKSLDLQEKRWLSKNERIKAAGGGICPYTGVVIGADGEIDHIVPRTVSRQQSNTIFNSEANLIWSTRQGNKHKNTGKMELDDLHPNYLKAVFDSTNRADIKESIVASIDRLPKRFFFQDLSDDEKNMVRHALFLPTTHSAYQKVFGSLQTRHQQRVNGTQKWFVRRVIVLLHKYLKEHGVKLDISASFLNPADTFVIRAMLAEHNAKYKQGDSVTLASRALDALCVFAAASADTLADEIKLGEAVSRSMEVLESFIGPKVDIIRVERRPRYKRDNIFTQSVFKEGLFRENFIHLWVGQNKIYAGFDASKIDNLLEVETLEPLAFLTVLAPYLECQVPFEEALRGGKMTRFTVLKDRAFELFSNVAKNPASTEELAAADILEGLRYTTVNANCQDYIYNQAKGSYKTVDEILDEKNFRLRFGFNKKGLARLNGELVLPAISNWSRLVHALEGQVLFGEKAPQKDLRQFLVSHFNSGSSRPHAKTRQGFSLPIKGHPSGGHRIRRRTPDGQPVWQLMSIDGLSTEGFYAKDGKTMLNQPKSFDVLNRGNVTPVYARHFDAYDAVTPLNQYEELKVDSDEVISVQVCPGTKTRRGMLISQNFDDFKRWVTNSGVEGIESYWDIPSELKVNPKAWEQAHGIEGIKRPYSALFVLEVGEKVVFRYIAA